MLRRGNALPRSEAHEHMLQFWGRAGLPVPHLVNVGPQSHGVPVFLGCVLEHEVDASVATLRDLGPVVAAGSTRLVDVNASLVEVESCQGNADARGQLGLNKIAVILCRDNVGRTAVGGN
eukprot:1753122-Rhodomonas_salina.5